MSALRGNLPADIDPKAVSIIVDEDIHRPLGTGFYFLRPCYFVTAKHVVVDADTGLPRENLVLMQRGPDYPKATVSLLHPNLDLAVLNVDRPDCEIPLFPSHERFAGQHGLKYWGYSPKLSEPASLKYTVVVMDVPHYTLDEPKQRDDGVEQVLRFDSPWSEGGHSGGPVLGLGGGVIAVIVEGHEGWLRATSSHALLRFFTLEASERE